MAVDVILSINVADLTEALDHSSRKFVGKLLKRHEIIDNRDVLKKETKELSYEAFRDLKDLLISIGLGGRISTFKFTKGK